MKNLFILIQLVFTCQFIQAQQLQESYYTTLIGKYQKEVAVHISQKGFRKAPTENQIVAENSKSVIEEYTRQPQQGIMYVSSTGHYLILFYQTSNIISAVQYGCKSADRIELKKLYAYLDTNGFILIGEKNSTTSNFVLRTYKSSFCNIVVAIYKNGGYSVSALPIL